MREILLDFLSLFKFKQFQLILLNNQINYSVLLDFFCCCLKWCETIFTFGLEKKCKKLILLNNIVFWYECCCCCCYCCVLILTLCEARSAESTRFTHLCLCLCSYEYVYSFYLKFVCLLCFFFLEIIFIYRSDVRLLIYCSTTIH